MALIRPEGVFLALFMFAVVLWRRGIHESTSLVLAFGSVFICVGGAYFAWRWSYFGYPLPNPFYKKGAGLHIESLRPSLQNFLTLCAPFFGAYLAIGLSCHRAMRRAAPALFVAAAFTGLWVLLSNEMNYAARFQYPVLVIVLMSWATLFPRPPDSTSPHLLRAAGRLTFGVPLLLLLLYAHWHFSDSIAYGKNGCCDVGCMLRQYKDQGYTMAISEAGLLPFYSQWRAIDTWGLNDQWIAHHGGQITEEYLDRYKPELIMFLGWPDNMAS